MTLNSNKKDFMIKSGLWKGYNLWSLYEKLKHLISGIRNYSVMRKKGIICFSTPFDETAVDLLEKLKAPIYKFPHLK